MAKIRIIIEEANPKTEQLRVKSEHGNDVMDAAPLTELEAWGDSIEITLERKPKPAKAKPAK